MARYKIYDNTSDVITPVGEKLTAEQWLDRYQWGRYTKMIVGGGIINGRRRRLRPDPHCGRSGRHGGAEPAG